MTNCSLPVYVLVLVVVVVVVVMRTLLQRLGQTDCAVDREFYGKQSENW